ncbi:hypothetical protein ACIQAL_22175 [Pseudomonas sp. NPDC088368]|uniref:hypothetical protein n=1 Tax=Pseudomonas sp. NPDC088368 TaxID=3364453 RepID=UPI003817DFE2
MDQFANESPRLKKFRKKLIATIPRFPNNKVTLQALQAMGLTELLVVYLGWKVRSVGMRPRQVIRAHLLDKDPKATALMPNIEALFRAVEAGDNLTPYLSLAAKSDGFTIPDPNHVKGLWADKDFLLNAMGFHHFHLGLTKEAAGHIERTDQVLFALVGRDEFEVVGLFTHDVFEHDALGRMTPERRMLWSIYERRLAEGRLPGEMYIGGMSGMGVSGSGAPIAIVETAFHYIRQIRLYEKQLKNFEFAKTLYSDGCIPATSKFEWGFNHLDLVLLDEAASLRATIAKGPN